MSDKMRWRYGDTNPVVAAVAKATVIEIGDLVYQDKNDTQGPASNVKPASAQADRESEEANQESFAKNFLGVAMQKSQSGETNPLRIATTGVFEFDCPSFSFELGDLIGVDENDGGKALEDQQVALVDTNKHAIARVAKRAATPTTSILIDIKSTIMTGGILSNSYKCICKKPTS